MTIEREYFNGPLSFICDNCGEVADTGAAVFEGALAKIRSRGWQIKKKPNGWFHFCPDCKS